ncbi:MAG: GH3 auxin-responsive promoter family protein [Planctomycetota bacterium]
MFWARHLRNTLGVFPRSAARRFAARYVREASDSRAAAARTLHRLIDLNGDARRWRRLKTETLRVPADLRRLPVTTYEDYRDDVAAETRGERGTLLGVDNPPLMFSRSSGTTGEPKLIPVTRAFVDDYRRGWRVWGIGAIDDHPGISLGTIMQLTSDHAAERTPAGIPVGQISGLVAAMQGPVIRSMMTLPPGLAKVADPDEKLALTVRLAAADRHVRLIATANPGTLTRLAKAIADDAAGIVRGLRDGFRTAGIGLRPRPRRARQLDRALERGGTLTPRDLWPDLALLGVWTGGCAALYRPLLERDYAPPAVRDHGLHASEGRMTIPLASGKPAGLLDVHAHVFEFIPVAEHGSAAPIVLAPDELEAGGEYFILLTTSSGFVRYDIGDVVRCVGFRGTTPLLEFLHKGQHVFSFTGEKVTESQVARAAADVVEKLNVAPARFVVVPEWGEPPRYRLLSDDTDRTSAATRAAAFEKALRSLNPEYDEKRATGRLRPLAAAPVGPDGWPTVETLIQQTSETPAEQRKPRALLSDQSFLERLNRPTEPVAA